ncbi:OmpA family protein [Pontibacter arcticus]|nr:OmpA family protein [Pontibacter arcticus]
MKKIVYTIAFILASGAVANAQSVLKEATHELADITVLQDDLLIYTMKEAGGQYIYTEKRGESGTVKKETILNTGSINTLIGNNPANNEVYVYQKNGRNEEVITFYTLQNGIFEKTGDRALPKLKNHSYNLGLFLSADKNTLLVAAELGKSRGHDDLYLSTWQNNSWSKPKNLGKSINTRQPEFAPFLASDTLYFSRKEADAVYAYSIPFSGGNVAGEAVKLDESINKLNTYNAYYKKQEDRQLWITASTDKATHTAFVLEKTVAAPEQVEEAPVVEVAKPAPAVKIKVAKPSLVMFHNLNITKPASQDMAKLTAFLAKQPEGTALVVKGYSDGYGSAEAKDFVSRNRAVQVQNYIQQNYPTKNFTITLESEVLEQKGKANRKTEVYLMQ